MSSNKTKAKRRAKAGPRRRSLKDLTPRKGQTQRIAGGSNANFPPGQKRVIAVDTTDLF